jgi:hypothetical protein
MTANLGSMDRMLRQVIAATMFWLVALRLVEGLEALVPMAIATLMIVTCHDRHCPVYRWLGWSTLHTAAA